MNKNTKYATINSHKRNKKILQSPFNQFNIKIGSWDKDLVPEYLWIDALARYYGNEKFHNYYFEYCKQIRKYVDNETAIFGFISDFGKISSKKRDLFKKEQTLIVKIFNEQLGKFLIFYPECPASWLLYSNLERNKENITKWGTIIEKLLPRNNNYVGHLRTMVFSQLINLGKFFMKKETGKLLLKYPHSLNEEEKYQVQSIARSSFNIYYKMNKEKEFPSDWVEYFWNNNFHLSPCMEWNIDITRLDPNEPNMQEIDEIKLKEILKSNIEILNKYIYEDLMKMEKKIYDPLKDEIILGLFTRTKRLYEFIILNDVIWNLDTSNIFLRCLCDTIFTLCYLVKQDDTDLFQKYLNYGEGKEKLLVLQIQDNYPDMISTGVEDISNIKLGVEHPFYLDLKNINFGNWTDTSIREMAIACNFKMEYSLIYNPASEDVHGSWMSVRKMNLIMCPNPLHRYHHIPQYFTPVRFLNPLINATRLINKLSNFMTSNYKFPPMTELNDFSELKASKPNNDLIN